MTTPTASEVLAGIDLIGKLAIVTGGSSGVGLETTRALAAAGAAVVVPARDVASARAALANVAGVTVQAMDLGDLASIRSFAGIVVAGGRQVDILINNAGIMATPETRVGKGWESQFAINHLGHFALTNALWPVLGAGSRVVAVASGVSRIRWEDPQFEHGYDKWEAYGQSKTANRLFALQLDALGAPTGIRAFSAVPGYILTPLQRHLTRDEMVAAGWVDESGAAVGDIFITPAQGAATSVFAATSPSLDGIGGMHTALAQLDGPIEAGFDSLSPQEVRAEAQRLWDYSAELVGAPPPGAAPLKEFGDRDHSRSPNMFD